MYWLPQNRRVLTMLFPRIVGPFPVAMFFGTETNPIPQLWLASSSTAQSTHSPCSILNYLRFLSLAAEVICYRYRVGRLTAQLNVHHFWTHHQFREFVSWPYEVRIFAQSLELSFTGISHFYLLLEPLCPFSA